jgi:hypothetical protein
VYGAAKAGIIALTVSHAQELARYGAKVNAVAPCARTRMVKASPNVLALMPESSGFDRHSPQHAAPLVAYLASDACRFTGRVFAVEGPDVAIYHPHGVEEHWSTSGAWSLDALTSAFATYPQRSCHTPNRRAARCARSLTPCTQIPVNERVLPGR